MENLAPPLHLTLELSCYLRTGLSLESSILSYLDMTTDVNWKREIQNWYVCYKKEGSTTQLKNDMKSSYRRTLFDYLETGLEGHPILESLEDLKCILLEESRRELDDYIVKLPFKAMIPLFLFQFPSFLILLLGPVLNSFLESLA